MSDAVPNQSLPARTARSLSHGGAVNCQSGEFHLAECSLASDEIGPAKTADIGARNTKFDARYMVTVAEQHDVLGSSDRTRDGASDSTKKSLALAVQKCFLQILDI